MNSLYSSGRLAVAQSAVLGAALLAAVSAQAQDFDAVRLVAAPAGQSAGQLGLALHNGAAYPGSDERYGTLLPVLDYQWANGWFAGTTNGVGLNLGSDPALQYGLRVTLDRGRDESRSSRLQGWGDLNARPELGVFLNHAPIQNVLLTSSVRYGSGHDRQGLVADLGVSVGKSVSPALRVDLHTLATFANASHQQSYFGISQAQVIPSGLPLYTPDAGWRDVRTAVALTYRIDPKWTLYSELGAKALLGDAKQSPVSRRNTEARALVALSYAI